MRRAARVDDNQAEIVAALRLAGCNVQSIAAVGRGCPDIIVERSAASAPGVPPVVMMEIKDGNKVRSARQLTEAEAQFHDRWAESVASGALVVVESVDDARWAMGLAVAKQL